MTLPPGLLVTRWAAACQTSGRVLDSCKAPLDLSVVIVTYNVADLLDRCLASVRVALEGLRGEVFVVDNASPDHTLQLVGRNHPWVELIASPRNGGFAYGNNLALRRARGRYALTLNPDTLLPPDALQRMVAFMDDHPEAGAAGPRLVMADGRLDRACRRGFPTPEAAFYRLAGLSRLFPRSRRFGAYNLTYLDERATAEVDSVCGAFMLVRAEVLRQVGLLDERYFMYGEDLDWAFRIKRAGWKVYYYPAVEVQHLKGQSSRQHSSRMLGHFYESMRIFYSRHFAPRHSPPFNWLVYQSIGLRHRISLAKNALRPPAARRVTT